MKTRMKTSEYWRFYLFNSTGQAQSNGASSAAHVHQGWGIWKLSKVTNTLIQYFRCLSVYLEEGLNSEEKKDEG